MSEQFPPHPAGKRFRILALDGGGIKGVFSAAVLATWEADFQKRDPNFKLRDHFDLIAGTSTGGIIAIGLGLGLTAQQILDFYISEGPEIFPCTSLVSNIRQSIWQLFVGPKHSQATLRDKLVKVFGDKKLGDSKNRLLIPTYETTANRIFLMKTYHHERFRYDYEALAVDVALVTSAAPTYFQAFNFPHHKNSSYIDGGVWANCPTMAALTETVAFLNQPLNNIDILNIGTTTQPFDLAKFNNASAAKWNINLVNLMFEASQQAAAAQASLLIGKDNFHRVDYLDVHKEFSLDDSSPEKIQKMIQYARGEAVKKEHIDLVKAKFLQY